MNKLKPYITAILITTFQSSAIAQSQPNYAAYQNSTDTSHSETTKTPQANFFPGGKSTSNFFNNKSVTPTMASNERIVTYGTDIFHRPSEQQVAPAPEPVESTAQIDTSSDTITKEDWSSSDNSNSDEAKTLTANIKKASEQSIDDPKIRSVLEQSKKIKEALFGTASTSTASTKKPLASADPGKTTKEIERF